MESIKKCSDNRYIKIISIIFCIIFLEVTIFNINFYRTVFGKLNYINFVGNDLSDKIELTTENTQYVSIENINSKVKTIYLKLDNMDRNKTIDYDIVYSDSSTSDRYLASKTYCEDVEKTKYSCISLSRKL